ncbi:MAG TPA: hypothetical protein PLL30_09065 [Candidatus Krumholzibacteria bacterium]|nr:hypothetical protein [Candidatus Krumholzibacteria bacterium]HPD71910.1 hypothetical protein [Candidatus Krumholzibacteria bacterium]HRY41157.1 hypothetical protein [Candidatus Krumholzibacteria bacterium]
MHTQKTIALVAHDHRKRDLADRVEFGLLGEDLQLGAMIAAGRVDVLAARPAILCVQTRKLERLEPIVTGESVRLSPALREAI